MFEIICKLCYRKIVGFSENQAKYLMAQHELSKKHQLNKERLKEMKQEVGKNEM